MQRIAIFSSCLTVVMTFSGCGDADGVASSDAGKRGPAQANDEVYTSRDAERIAVHRTQLRERVQGSLDEAKMLTRVREQYDIEGYEPTAAFDVRTLGHYDETTGEWSWQALECVNPQCRQQSARPFLFPHVIQGATIGDNGKPVWPKGAVMQPVCPKCGRKDTVGGYTLPETTARRSELEEELRTSRAARQQGDATSGTHRTPQEIMDEMAALPKVYLLPEQEER